MTNLKDKAAEWAPFMNKLLHIRRREDHLSHPVTGEIRGFTYRGERARMEIREIRLETEDEREFHVLTYCNSDEKRVEMTINICNTTNIAYVGGSSLTEISLPKELQNKGLTEAAAAHAIRLALDNGAKTVYTRDFGMVSARAIKMKFGGLLVSDEAKGISRVEFTEANLTTISKFELTTQAELKKAAR